MLHAHGNTVAKLANSITDTPVLVAARTILKDSKPLVIGFCCKDGLSFNAENIGKLLNKKDLFFVPFRQDNPITKPYSICFDYKYIVIGGISMNIKQQIQKSNNQVVSYIEHFLTLPFGATTTRIKLGTSINNIK